MSAFITILGMALITLLIKAAVLVWGERWTFPPALQRALGFVPVTVLTAIIVPMVLAPHGQGLELGLHNPQLGAALLAVAVCVATRHQLLTICLGLAAFFAWQYALGAF
jgi:branched-subunit amino acid transport protein